MGKQEKMGYKGEMWNLNEHGHNQIFENIEKDEILNFGKIRSFGIYENQKKKGYERGKKEYKENMGIGGNGVAEENNGNR